MLFNQIIGLTAVEKAALTVSKSLSLGLKMAVSGMGIVFLVLVFLWALVAIFRVVFSGSDKEKTQKVPKEITVSASAEPSVSTSQSLELVAVISAAIEAYRQGSGETGAFRVVSFQKRK